MSPTPISVREQVIRIRLALILIAAAALPGAVHSIGELVAGRVASPPVARWRAVELPRVARPRACVQAVSFDASTQRVRIRCG